MAGYLDTYGAADIQRARKTKQILAVLGIVLVLGMAGYLFFHNRAEKQVVARFLDQLQAGNYQDAYRKFGCTPASPCRDYSFEKFMEDWGPKGQYANTRAAQITTVDSCGAGVVLTMQLPNIEPFGLWVDRGTKVLGYSPWPRCPGRHWHFMEFISRHF